MLNVPFSRVVVFVPVRARFILDPPVPKLTVPVPALIAFEVTNDAIDVLRSSVTVVGSLELMVMAFAPVRTSVSVVVLSLMVTAPLLAPVTMPPMEIVGCPREEMDTAVAVLKLAMSIVPVEPGKAEVLAQEPAVFHVPVAVPPQVYEVAKALSAIPQERKVRRRRILGAFIRLVRL
jgi:hypothetical protein